MKDEEYKAEIQNYVGYEDIVLSIRNRNRNEKKNREYFDWRYTGQITKKEPIIILIRNKKHEIIAMLGLIFRPYYVNKSLQYIAIVGDISVDKMYRRKGIGTLIVKSLNQYINKNSISYAFVIPTIAAQDIFKKCGWKTGDLFIPMVYILDLKKYLSAYLKKESCLLIISQIFKVYKKILFLTWKTDTINIKEIKDIKEEGGYKWNIAIKENLIVGDKGIENLEWRYQKHPNKNKYKIIFLIIKGEISGLVVHAIDKQDRCCVIYDILLFSEKNQKQLLKAYIKYINKQNIESIRTIFCESHPYRKIFKEVGFIQRKSESLLQFYTKKNTFTLNKMSWFISSGDKDV